MPGESDVRAWFGARVPEGWSRAQPEVEVDGDEILVTVELPEDGAADAAAREGRIARFREESREQRMRIAEEGQRKFRRKVSWAAAVGDLKETYTTLSMPVMTRLRQPERQVLDTLIAAGVARSRSEALNWCVRLVAEKQAEWLKDLKSALEAVEKARAKGPKP
jgi:Arc/MetJ-type ribon-helix-helix transcriptional regulator